MLVFVDISRTVEDINLNIYKVRFALIDILRKSSPEPVSFSLNIQN